MEYQEIFIIIFFIGCSLGIILAILNNNIIMINDENNHSLYKKGIEIKNNNYLIDEEDKDNSNIERNNIIPIAINVDNNYYLQAIVFLTSLLENIGPKTKYEIYILIPNYFYLESKKNIDSLIDKYGNEKIKFKYIIMKDTFLYAITSQHISTAAYYRLLLPSILPNIDKIIYSDCDVINFEDLSNLYNIQIKDNIYYMGFPDYYSHMKELLQYGVYSNIYMNSGILLINLKSLRKNGIEKKLIKICDEEILEHHDQTAINLVCSRNIDRLPIKYAIFNFETYNDLIRYNNEQSRYYRYKEDELKEAYNSPVMLHYAGFGKPWNHQDVKFEEYWWFYALKTDFYEQILNLFKYTYLEVENKIKKIPSD